MSCEFCTYGYTEVEDFKPHYDEYGNVAEITVDCDGGFCLEAKTDGTWSYVKVTHCPWCGDELWKADA